MYGQSELPEEDGLAPQEMPADLAVPDPLRQLHATKRWTQIGVYLAILGYGPLYLFVFGYELRQVLTSWTTGIIIATVAIELAFAQMFKLRKQSAYPSVLIVQLGEMESLTVAYQTGLTILSRLLNLSGSFLCLNQKGSLALVALTGLSRLQTDRFLRLGAADIQEAMDSPTPVPFRPASVAVSAALLSSRHVLIFVPVRSLQGPIGVLGLLTRRSNKDVKVPQLLTGMGVALGLSLENLRHKEELRKLAAMDELTKVYNRRYFFDELDREMAFATRYSSPLAVAILDLDGLKAINDRLGHAAGDEVLAAVALRLVRYSRASDLVARIGGDEFALILPRTDSQGAQEMAVRLQRAVEQQPVALADGQDLTVTVSCGTASYPQDAADAEALLRRADAVMYCGKAARPPASNL